MPIVTRLRTAPRSASASTRSATRLRLFMVLVALSGSAACDRFDAAGDRRPTSTSPAAELLAARAAGTLTEQPPSTVAEAGGGLSMAGTDLRADAGVQAGAAGAPADSQAAPRAELQERIARLEAANDSLRATVLGLISLQARLPEVMQSPQPAPDSVDATSAEEILDAGAGQVRNWGLRIFFALVFLALVWGVTRFVGWVLNRLAERSAQRRLFYKRLAPITRILLWVLAATFTALVILDIDAGGLVAAGAAGGVALGFASQDILKNVFGGLIVLFDQPFQVGDKISVAGSYGEVVSIGLRSTRIVTPDDNLVTVPNAQVVDGQVANANAGELNCQVVTDLWLPGWVDEARAKEIAYQAASTSRFVFHNKPIVVLVTDEFDRVPLTHLKVKAYVLDPRYEFLFASDVTERARASFRDAGLLPRERGFDSEAVDFYDFLAEGRWGGRLPARGAQDERGGDAPEASP